jgi:hypothetical protein
MTILVTPIKPFRAWQYRKDLPAPEWVSRRTGYGADCHWAVENAKGGIDWFSPGEFAARFRPVDSIESNLTTSPDGSEVGTWKQGFPE